MQTISLSSIRTQISLEFYTELVEVVLNEYGKNNRITTENLKAHHQTLVNFVASEVTHHATLTSQLAAITKLIGELDVLIFRLNQHKVRTIRLDQ